MPQYTLKYFPAKALGECIRLLLAANGEDFKDIRIEPEQWAKEKAKSPFGQMPILEIDGKQYAQSTSICRYLGKKFGYSGATLEEDLQIDQAVDTYNDLRSKLQSAFYISGAEQEKKYDEVMPQAVQLFVKLNDIAGSNNGHIALGKLTWGDFVVAGMYDYMKVMSRISDMDTKYPNIKQVSENVYSIPKVKAWSANAPKASY